MTALHVMAVIAAVGVFVAAGSAESAAATTHVYIGTYTRGTSKGIYRLDFDSSTGDFMGAPELVVEVKNPEFLAMSPDGTHLYSSDSKRGNQPRPDDGTVNSFAITADSPILKPMNHQPCGGDGATYVLLDHDAKNLFAVAYGAATVAMLPVNGDGQLLAPTVVVHHHGSSVNHSRQESAHPHSITLDPAGKFAFVPDLGCDKIYVYRVDSSAHTMVANDPPFVQTPAGSGPRRICFTGDAKFAYAVTEMRNTVVTYRYDAGHGVLTQVQAVSTLPPGFTGTDTAAEVSLGADERFVYASNRGDDSIVVLQRDTAAGTLTPVSWQSTLGKGPRHFTIDPSGRWLLAANQYTASVKVFAINPVTGALSLGKGSAHVDTPVCVLFDRIRPR